MSLTGKQRRHLRGLGQELNPVVLIGQQGIDARVLAAIATALNAHELVKIKLLENFGGDRYETAENLAAKTNAELVQVLGKTILLYKTADEPNIQFPA
jgi:RNA-binding protein